MEELSNPVKLILHLMCVLKHCFPTFDHKHLHRLIYKLLLLSVSIPKIYALLHLLTAQFLHYTIPPHSKEDHRRSLHKKQ